MPTILSRFWVAACGGVGLLLASAVVNAAPVPVCTANPPGGEIAVSCSFTRAMDFWFGTLTVQGAVAPSQDFFRSTDHFTNILGFAIQADSTVDARVVSGMSPYVDLSGAIEWVIGAPENLPAQQNLLADYAAADAALDALFGPGTLSLAPVAATNANYQLALVLIFCPIDSSPPACDGSAEEFFLADVAYRAQVNMFEQNAVWTLDTPPATQVPEPVTVGLLGLGFVSLAMLRRRRGHGRYTKPATSRGRSP